MGWYIFFGVFAAVGVAIAIGVVTVRRKLRRISKQYLGTEDFMAVMEQQEVEDSPKSVRGMDSILIPRILKDFPDFDVNMAKTYGRNYLKEKLRNKKELKIHRLVFSDYLTSSVQKTVVMQAALCYKEGEKLVQTRYDLHYAYKLGDEHTSVAANCPNCGAAMGYGQTVCAYCGARVVNVLKNSWEFTRMVQT